jgi:hypothetical protein
VSIRKLPNGRWEARERTGGRGSRRLSQTFDRKGDAERWVQRIRRQRQLGEPLEQEDITLAEFVEVFWEMHAVPNLAPATRESYKNVWARHVRPRLGGRALRELTPKLLTRFRVDLERADVGAATVRKALALVQSMLSFAVVEERLEYNAAASVRKPHYERAREPHIFLPLDVERIRAQLDSRSAMLVSLLAYSGPRPEEALRLPWRGVGDEALHFDGRKTRRPRWTPLLDALGGDLRRWRLESGRPAAAAPVIAAHDGGFWQADDWRNWRRRTWGSWRKDKETGQRDWVGAAPAGTRPRDLRSSYVTVQVYAGVPLTTIARWCGTSVAMLDKHYAGVIANWDGVPVPADELIRRAREQLAEGGGRSRRWRWQPVSAFRLHLRQSRRPDSNRGPLHYESRTTRSRLLTTAHGIAARAPELRSAAVSTDQPASHTRWTLGGRRGAPRGGRWPLPYHGYTARARESSRVVLRRRFPCSPQMDPGAAPPRATTRATAPGDAELTR